ncbi:MAG: hypothetical protein HY365_00365 [Candidatus Aenigmarchaeota archaeon]|nr:hypothetical protein [Candidatus Aenigmarchaeota archaeon]
MLKKFYRLGQKSLALVIVCIFAAGLLGGYYFFSRPALEGNEVTMKIAAVNGQGNGVIGELITVARPASIPGSGQILVSVNSVLSQYDTQLSARAAVLAAGKYTNKNVNDYDIIYVIKADAQAIEGPSAGAAMAISAVAAIENRTLDNSVVITGGIREDGVITAVGGVAEKAGAARDAGATTFLVPTGQLGSDEIERTEQCYLRRGRHYCIVDYVQKKSASIDGLSVIEVSNIGDAIKYFMK